MRGGRLTIFATWRTVATFYLSTYVASLSNMFAQPNSLDQLLNLFLLSRQVPHQTWLVLYDKLHV